MPFVSAKSENETYAPCCFYKTQGTYNTLNDYLDSEELAEIQNHMLTQDGLPSGCEKCDFYENTGQISVRQERNNFFNNIIARETDIRELDIMFSNTCNLNCVMCTGFYSSSINSENKKLNLPVYNNWDRTEKILYDLQSVDKLDHITISGGEIFYSKYIDRILERLTDMDIGTVKIFTNATVVNRHILDKLNKLSHVNLHFSVDCIGDYYNLIRWPANWNQVSANIDQFRNGLNNATFDSNCVLQPLNVAGFVEWLEYCNSKNINTNYMELKTPEHLSWCILTDEEKQSASNHLLEQIKKSSVADNDKVRVMNIARRTIQNYKYNQQLRSEFVNFMCKKIHYRKVSVITVQKCLHLFPQLSSEISKKLIDLEKSKHDF